MTIKLFLPIPVTVNKAYCNNARWGRVKTKATKDWEREARYFAQVHMQEHGTTCRENLRTRANYFVNPKRGYDLQALQADFPDLSYEVVYKFTFPNPNVRDIFNFEKLLSDFLVECGFMLDDLFIDRGHVMRMKPNAEAPRVDIEINTLDIKGEVA